MLFEIGFDQIDEIVMIDQMLMIVMMMKVELIKWIVMQNVMTVFEEELPEVAQIVFVVEVKIGLKVVHVLEFVRR